MVRLLFGYPPAHSVGKKAKDLSQRRAETPRAWRQTEAGPRSACHVSPMVIPRHGLQDTRLKTDHYKGQRKCLTAYTVPALRPASDHPDAKPIPRSKSAFELFFSAAFLLWWIRVSPIRKLALFVVLGPVGLADKIPFRLGPVWETVYWGVIILTLVAIVQQMVTLIYPDRLKFYSVMKLISNGGNIVILYLLTRTNQILVLVPGIADGAEFAETLRIVNMTLHYTMIFTAILTAAECVKQIRRLFRLGRTPATAASTMV
jgi:hypothetical protein